MEKIKDVDEGCFVSPVVFTLKSDKSVKIAKNSRMLNDSFIKMRLHMPNMEELLNQLSKSTSESEESIHHIKGIKAIEEKNNHYAATIKINGVKKEFIIDTRSPITIMPPDERIMKHAEIQIVTN